MQQLEAGEVGGSGFEWHKKNLLATNADPHLPWEIQRRAIIITETHIGESPR